MRHYLLMIIGCVAMLTIIYLCADYLNEQDKTNWELDAR